MYARALTCGGEESLGNGREGKPGRRGVSRSPYESIPRPIFRISLCLVCCRSRSRPRASYITITVKLPYDPQAQRAAEGGSITSLIRQWRDESFGRV